MPIKFSFRKLPVDESGKAYDSIEDFQAAELSRLLAPTNGCGISHEEIVSKKSEVIEILEINEHSLPAARGQKRPRKPKTVPAAEDTTKAA